jgi:YD repeat-containing protein
MTSVRARYSTVFVSYSMADRQFVEKEILPLLDRNGIHTWGSWQRMRTAEPWERAVLQGIEECDWFLVVMSPDAVKSQWVRKEVHWAMEYRRGRIIVVLIKDCDVQAVHPHLPLIQPVDFRRPGPESAASLLRSFEPAQPREYDLVAPRGADAPVVVLAGGTSLGTSAAAAWSAQSLLPLPGVLEITVTAAATVTRTFDSRDSASFRFDDLPLWDTELKESDLGFNYFSDNTGTIEDRKSGVIEVTDQPFVGFRFSMGAGSQAVWFEGTAQAAVYYAAHRELLVSETGWPERPLCPAGGGGSENICRGGVLLDKAASFVGDLQRITGATVDPVTGQVVLLITQGGMVEAPRLEDFVSAVRSVYGSAEGPGVTIDPQPGCNHDPYNPQFVHLFGGLENTDMGYVMFEADRVMKYIPSGRDNVNGNTMSRAYDSAARLTSVTDSLGRVTSYTYEAVGRLRGATASDLNAKEGTITEYQYDADGCLTPMADQPPRPSPAPFEDAGTANTVALVGVPDNAIRPPSDFEALRAGAEQSTASITADTVQSRSEEDWFRFDAVAGDRLRIVTLLPSANLSLLYDSALAIRALLDAPAAAPSEETGIESVKTDLVDCSVYSPPSVAPGQTIIVQVFAHLPEQIDEATRMATSFDASAAWRVRKNLEAEVPRGAKLRFDLTAPGLKIGEPAQTLVWRGRPDSVQFAVTASKRRTPGTVLATVTVSLNSVPIGHVKFKLSVAPPEAGQAAAKPEWLGDDARRYSLAFVSYAREDRVQVVARVQMLQAVRIRYFQDVLAIDPGKRWKKELYRYIDQCDLFLLFWSRNAKKSKWVRKEARRALARKAGDELAPPEIQPVILERPPARPWRELRDIHFDDRLTYLMAEEEE